MKAFVAVAALAPLVAAQTTIPDLIAQIPSCALAPLAKEIPAATGCGVTDYACSCTAANVSKLTAVLTPILLSACGVQQSIKVQQITSQICSIEKTLPASGSASAATGTMATATAASMTMGSSMSGMSGMTMSMSEMSSSMAMSMSMAMTTTNMGTTASAAAASSGSKSAAAAASTSAGGAAKLGGSVGGAVLLAAAALAL